MAATSIDTLAAAGTPARPAKSKQARFIGYAVYALAALIVGIWLANVLWRMSGSNRWELELEKNGVRIYSLKAPGSSLKQFKGVMRARYSLNQLIASLIENANIDACRKFIPGCIDVQVVEAWNSRTLSDSVLWKLQLPGPFAPREILLQSLVAQDPVSKTVVVDIIAAPNKAPRNQDSVRLTYVQNRWRYTPLGNGEIEIEFLQDMDLGGLFPDLLQNLAGPSTTYTFLHDQLPALLDNDKFRQANYDFITEA